MIEEPKFDIKAITTTSILVAIAVMFAVSMFLVPFLRVGIMFISIPIIIIGIKFDLKMQIIATVLLGLITLILEPIYAINVVTSAGILGIVQGYFIKQKRTNSEVIFFGTLASFFGLIVYLYVLNSLANINMLEDIKNIINDVFSDMGAIYRNSNMLSKTDTMTLLQVFDKTKSILILMIPTTFLLTSFMYSIINFLVARVILLKLKLPVRKTKFKDFRIGKQGKLILLSVFFVVAIMALIDVENQNIYIINFSSILILLLQINGFALLWYFTEIKSNTVALRIFSVLLFIFAPLLGGPLETIIRFSVVLFGLTDIFYDFRKRYIEKHR